MNKLLMRLNFLHKIYILKAAQEREFLFIPFSLFSISAFILFYVLTNAGFELLESEEFFIRSICVLVLLALSLKNYWPKRIQKFKYYLWHIALVLTIPFFDSYIAIKNLSDITFVDLFMGIFQLCMLVGIIPALLNMVIGFSLGFIVYYIEFRTISPHFVVLSNVNVLYSLYIFAYSVFLLYIRELFSTNTLQALEKLSSTIAHEIRTPLATIATYGNLLKENLPLLISNNISISKHIDIIPKQVNLTLLSETLCHEIKNSANVITDEIKNIFLVIDMLLMQINISKHTTFTSAKLSMRNCINTSIIRFNISPEESTLIHLNLQNDFEFLGNEILFVHIFFNLLQNALYTIKKANKGEIFIWFEPEGEINTVHFKDTGIGIKPQTIENIFHPFYSSKQYGSGIGLSYCKEVVEMYKGTIECYSVYGLYTEFVIRLPKVSANQNLE